MFIGFANLDKHFEHAMLIAHVYWVCKFGQTLWTVLKKNPENIGSGKRIYNGKFICSSTCHDAFFLWHMGPKILIYWGKYCASYCILNLGSKINIYMR